MIQTLGNGLLYQVHRSRNRLIAEMERRTAIRLTIAILVCVAWILWMVL